MWSGLIKKSLSIDLAILASLSYITALLIEQLKPGFFSNSLDINLLLGLALVSIVLVLLLKPVYQATFWVRLYYGLWCLALLMLFAKLVTGWLGWSFGAALGLVLLISGILALTSYIYRHNSGVHHPKQ